MQVYEQIFAKEVNYHLFLPFVVKNLPFVVKNLPFICEN